MAGSRPALSLLLALASVGAVSAAVKPWLCPPKQFDSVPNFSLAKFISAPWFVQQQTPLKSQPATNLYCARVKLSPADPKDLTKGVKVCNYANVGGVNKKAVGNCHSGAAGLLGLPWPARRSPDPSTAASKLLVGPATLIAGKTADDLAKPPPPGQARLAGPWWVVAVGPSKTPALGYDWAIVTGGPPSQATENDACVPPAKTDDGFWLLHRLPVAPKADVAAMLAAASAPSLRLDVKALSPVTQAGCTFAGAVA